MPEAHVRLEGVTKRFAGAAAAAVEGVSLRIPGGSFTTLLGPSGCGKTTTLRMIAGFYEPDSGDIFIGERRVNAVPVHRRKIAMVFQDYALFPHMSVEDNVSYGLRLARLRTLLGAESQESAKHLAELEVGLEKFPAEDRARILGALVEVHNQLLLPAILLLTYPLVSYITFLLASPSWDVLLVSRH